MEGNGIRKGYHENGGNREVKKGWHHVKKARWIVSYTCAYDNTPSFVVSGNDVMSRAVESKNSGVASVDYGMLMAMAVHVHTYVRTSSP